MLHEPEATFELSTSAACSEKQLGSDTIPASVLAKVGSSITRIGIKVGRNPEIFRILVPPQ